MAAGLITIAHNSGGPKEDIIKHKETGFLASQPEEYAECLESAFENYQKLTSLRENARKHVQLYSEDNFSFIFTQSLQPFLS